MRFVILWTCFVVIVVVCWMAGCGNTVVGENNLEEGTESGGSTKSTDDTGSGSDGAGIIVETAEKEDSDPGGGLGVDRDSNTESQTDANVELGTNTDTGSESETLSVTSGGSDTGTDDTGVGSETAKDTGVGSETTTDTGSETTRDTGSETTRDTGSETTDTGTGTGSDTAGEICSDPCVDGLGNPISGCGGRCGGIAGDTCENEELVCVHAVGIGDGVGYCLPPAALDCKREEDCSCYPDLPVLDAFDLAWTCTDQGRCAPAIVEEVDPNCQEDSDCILISTCCHCMVAPRGTEPPNCELEECLAGACERLGVDENDMGCWNLGCGIPAAQGNCNAEDVTCGEPLQTCPDDYYSAVVDGCWSACVLGQRLCLSS